MTKHFCTVLTALVLVTIAGRSGSAEVATGIALPELSAAVHERISQEQRLALVIGNTLRPESDHSAADAKAMAVTLRHLGFEVTEVLDVTREDLDRSIVAFTHRLHGTGGVGLFYYSGQGIEIDGEGYLVLTDTLKKANQDAVSIRQDSLSVRELVGRMEDARPGVNLIFLDTCRNNPFIKGPSETAVDSDLAVGTLIGYATGPGHSASTGLVGSENSPFTAALLKAIVTPGVEVATLFSAITRDVMRATDRVQTPQFTYSLMKPFFFIPSLEEAR